MFDVKPHNRATPLLPMRGFGDLLWPCLPSGSRSEVESQKPENVPREWSAVHSWWVLTPHAPGCGLQSLISLLGSASVSQEFLSLFVEDGVFVAPLPLHSYAEAPIPKVMVFGGGVRGS